MVGYAPYELVANLAAGNGIEKIVDRELVVLGNTHFAIQIFAPAI